MSGRHLLYKQQVPLLERPSVPLLDANAVYPLMQPLSNVLHVDALGHHREVLLILKRHRNERREQRQFALIIQEKEKGESAKLGQQSRAIARNEAKHVLNRRTVHRRRCDKSKNVENHGRSFGT